MLVSCCLVCDEAQDGKQRYAQDCGVEWPYPKSFRKICGAPSRRVRGLPLHIPRAWFVGNGK
jgi:hypothetical protein